MGVIDGHLHIFSRIHGANQHGAVTGVGYGQTENGGQTSFFMPPLHESTCFTAEMALALMDQHGVERAVLMQNPTIGSVNEEVGKAIASYPDRFSGALQVDPYDPQGIGEMTALAKAYPFAALKLELSAGWGWTGIHHDAAFAYDRVRPLVENAQALGLAVVVDTGDTASYAYRPQELGRLAADFPTVPFVVEHGGYLTPEGNVRLWLDMVDTAMLDNVFLGICAMPVLMEDPYPCPATQAMLRYLAGRVGAHKLIWGTDAPTTLKAYTYRQMLHTVAEHTPFLGEAERGLVLSENAKSIYFG